LFFTNFLFAGAIETGVGAGYGVLFFGDSSSGITDARAGVRWSPTDSTLFEFSLRGRIFDIASPTGDFLFAPEIGAGLRKKFSPEFGIFAGMSFGYSISAKESSSFDGAYLLLDAGAMYYILPILDARLFVQSSPTSFPIGSKETKRSFGGGISLSYRFGFHDKDRDWISDELDTCPDTPRRVKVNKSGCPLDTDGDGVFDGPDKCPDTPLEALVDSNGCPGDADKDGVYDGVDICDETPKNIAVDSLGCPKDSDDDGVPDFADSCARTLKGASVDEKGCTKDSDEDGIPDGLDQCPQTPTGFVVNAIGCPFSLPVEREEIQDAYDASLNIKASALQKLDAIAERIRAYPYRIIEIGVYTDDEGSATYNINRGYRVAERVRDVLIGRGVKTEQLVLKGYGEAYQIVSNGAEDGQKKNRRIVFKFLKEKF
jgi:hypothetical protein